MSGQLSSKIIIDDAQMLRKESRLLRHNCRNIISISVLLKEVSEDLLTALRTNELSRLKGSIKETEKWYSPKKTLREKFKAGVIRCACRCGSFRAYSWRPSYRSPQWNGCNGLSVAPLLDDRLPGPVALPSIPRLFSDELNLERRPQQGCLSYDSEKRTVIRIKSYRISSLKDSGVDLQELTFWRA